MATFHGVTLDTFGCGGDHQLCALFRMLKRQRIVSRGGKSDHMRSRRKNGDGSRRGLPGHDEGEEFVIWFLPLSSSFMYMSHFGRKMANGFE